MTKLISFLLKRDEKADPAERLQAIAAQHALDIRVSQMMAKGA